SEPSCIGINVSCSAYCTYHFAPGGSKVYLSLVLPPFLPNIRFITVNRLSLLFFPSLKELIRNYTVSDCSSCVARTIAADEENRARFASDISLLSAIFWSISLFFSFRLVKEEVKEALRTDDGCGTNKMCCSCYGSPATFTCMGWNLDKCNL